MESFRRPVDGRALYVAVSRARDQARLYTDDRTRLAAATGLRDGSQAAALDHELDQDFGDCADYSSYAQFRVSDGNRISIFCPGLCRKQSE